MGGSSGKTTTVQQSDPWSGQKPYLTAGFERALDYVNSPTPQYYQGQTVADLSNPTQQGINQLSGFTGSSGYQTAMQGMQDTASGKYLDPNSNPNFQAMVNQSIAAARPSVDSAFAANGRLGSGNHMAAFSDAATRAATGLGYQNYQQERQNQLNAQTALPGLQMQGIQAQLTGGGMLDTQQQRQLDAAKAASDYNRDARLEQLRNYVGLVQGNFGGTTQGTAQGTGNPWMQGAGAGIGLLGAAGQFGQGAKGFAGLFGSTPSNGLSYASPSYGGDWASSGWMQ